MYAGDIVVISLNVLGGRLRHRFGYIFGLISGLSFQIMFFLKYDEQSVNLALMIELAMAEI